MKILFRSFLVGCICISGCNHNSKKGIEVLETQPITVFKFYQFQLPIGFSSSNENNWNYQNGNKMGKLYLAQVINSGEDVSSLLDKFQNEKLEGDINDYELINTDSVHKVDKTGIIRSYKKNENGNKDNPYAIYTYHTIGLLKYQNNLFKIKSSSFNFDLNPTITKIFFQIQQNIEQPASSIKTKRIKDLTNMSVYKNHSIASPKKYHFEGENTDEVLNLKCKKSNKTIYYLASRQLEPNMDIAYYFEGYKENLVKGGFNTRETLYQGLQALLGKMQTQGAYIYQLHFVNSGKGQTIQMLSDKASDKEFEAFMNEIVIVN